VVLCLVVIYIKKLYVKNKKSILEILDLIKTICFSEFMVEHFVFTNKKLTLRYT